MSTVTNIVIVGRRPGQTEDHYYNKFTQENAAVHGATEGLKDRLLTKLRQQALLCQDFWLFHEPEGTIVNVVNEPVTHKKGKR